MLVAVELGLLVVTTLSLAVASLSLIVFLKGQKDQRGAAIRHAKPGVTATVEVISAHEYGKRGYLPPSNRRQLLVTIYNAGPGVATIVTIAMNSGRFADFGRQVGPVAVGGNRVWYDAVDSDSYDMVIAGDLPASVVIEYSGDGWEGGRVDLQMQAAPTPVWRVTATSEPVISGRY